MAEPGTWTPADDEIVRSALSGLRRDVDAVPLAEPASIRGRGDARRRQRWLGWGAAAAAAVVIAAAVGYATLGRDQGTPVPPATPTTTASALTPSIPPSSGVAIDEKMPVAGPKPLLDSALFVAGSQWASPALTGGKQSSAGAGEWEGSAAVTECDADTSTTGRFGIIRVRSSSTGAYFGAQRVRILNSAQGASDYASRLRATIGRGCDFPNGTNKVAAGAVEGTYRVDMTFADGSTTITSFVGYSSMETPNTVTTVVVWGLKDPTQGFDELARLLALARQK